MMQFECGCGKVITVEDDGPDYGVNCHTTCGECESKYAVTVSVFEQKFGADSN